MPNNKDHSGDKRNKSTSVPGGSVGQNDKAKQFKDTADFEKSYNSKTEGYEEGGRKNG